MMRHAFAFVALLGSSPVWAADPTATTPPSQRKLAGLDAVAEVRLRNKMSQADASRKFDEALAVAQEMLDLRTRLLGADHWQTVNARFDRDRLAVLARLPPAETAAYARLRSAGDSDIESTIKKGQFEKAEKSRQAYRTFCARHLGESHPAVAMLDFKAAVALRDRGRYAESDELFASVLKRRQEVLGERHPYLYSVHVARAYGLERQGKFAEAQVLWRKTLEARRELLGDDHELTRGAYENLATNLQLLGRYHEAELLLKKALEIERQVSGDYAVTTLNLAKTLADNLRREGKNGEAVALYELNRDRVREMHGGASAPKLDVYAHNHALQLSSAGKHTEAEPFYRADLALKIKMYGAKGRDAAQAHLNLAANLNRQEKLAEAEAEYRAAVEINRSLGPRDWTTALALGRLGQTLVIQKKFDEAEQTTRAALEIGRERRGIGHPNTTTMMSNLASIKYFQGKYTEAATAFEEAIGSFEISRGNIADRGLDAAEYASRSPYHLLAFCRARLNDPVAAWKAVEMDRGRGLLDELQATDGDDERRLRQQLVELQARAESLFKVSQLGGEQPELKKAVAERSAAEAKLLALVADRSTRAVAPLERVQAALPDDAALICWIDFHFRGDPPGNHWVCVVRRTGPPRWEMLPGTGPDGVWTLEDINLPGEYLDALHAGKATSDLAKRLHTQRLEPATRHLAGVKRLHVISVETMAGVPVETLTDRFEISYTPSGGVLAAMHGRPRPKSDGLLAVGDPVFVAPAQATATLPEPPPSGFLVASLEHPFATAHFYGVQLNDIVISYNGVALTSPDHMVMLWRERRDAKSTEVKLWRESAGKEITLELGPGALGINFARMPAPDIIKSRRETAAKFAAAAGDLPELPGTRVEVDRLGKLFGEKAVALFDQAASERRLEQMRVNGDLIRFRYIHFATHGESNRVKAFESVLHLSAEKAPASAMIAESPTIDAKLSAREVRDHWKLNADLVTLSACESALGRWGGGEGSLGFAQAFLTAGARSVCLSLWKVDDAATALLMGRFYQNLLGKGDRLNKPMSKAAALAEAKAWLRNLTSDEAKAFTAESTRNLTRGDRGKGAKLELVVPREPSIEAPAVADRPFAHPRYWAAFILIGDPE